MTRAEILAALHGHGADVDMVDHRVPYLLDAFVTHMGGRHFGRYETRDAFYEFKAGYAAGMIEAARIVIKNKP